MNSDEALNKWHSDLESKGFNPDFESCQMGWNAALEWVNSGQKPVAYINYNIITEETTYTKVPVTFDRAEVYINTPLYTHPAPAQPVRLSVEEIEQALEVKVRPEWWDVPQGNTVDFANAIQDAMLAKGAAQPAVVQPLYDALSETHLDLTILLGNIFASASKDKNWGGMYDVVNGWITRNHKAIAQAEAALAAYKENGKCNQK